MKTNLPLRNLTPLLTLLALLFSTQIFAQPANDDCVDAIEFTIAADEASCIEVSGTTLDATESSAPSDVCSGSWFADDVWFKFSTGATLPEGSIVVKVNFGTLGSDLNSVGMALYESCDANELVTLCYSDDNPEKNQIAIHKGSLMTNQTYYVRIWSGGSPNDNSGSFRVCGFINPPDEDVVIWDGGQFDGGMGDWTTVGITSDTALWTYKDCSCAAGAFRSQTISSPTAHNGAMVFDADVLNTGVTGSPPYPMHTGELISPVIDCSTFEAVSLKYYQSYEALNGNTYYSYSLDGGATWVDNIEVNEDIAANDGTFIPDNKRHFISEAAGVDSFRVKFIFDGDYYNWILDDVQLIQPERNNLALVNDFYAIAPNAVTPASQVEPFSFIADVANIGAVTQTNVSLNVTIDDNSGEAFTADLFYDTIAGGGTAFDVPFPDYFTPDGSLNDYSGTYQVTSDSVDFDSTDNFQFFTFSTSDTVFAKETGMTRTILPAANNWEGEMEPHSWAYGNYYHIVDGDNWWASSATFGLGNADEPGIAGRLITIWLYKWDKDAPGGVSDSDMDPEEREPVGFYVYEILGTELTTDLITVPLINYPSNEPGPIDLESDEAYVLVVEYSTNDEVDFALVASDVLEYRGMIFRTEEIMDIADPGSRYGSMLAVNGDLTTEPYSSLGFGRDLVPVVRLNISPTVSVDETLDAANIIEISPNPADQKINLNIDLVEIHANVNVRILDVSGRLILDQSHQNVQSEMLQFDVSGFATGAYFLHFITEKGVRTERFIVQH